MAKYVFQSQSHVVILIDKKIMSRLNDTIKLVVMLGNVFFTILSGLAAIGSALVLSGKISTLNFEAAKAASVFVLLISVTVLLCTLLGCCGAVNQVIRRGRSILTVFECLNSCYVNVNVSISVKEYSITTR